MKNEQPEQLSLPLDLKPLTRNFCGYFQYMQEYDRPIFGRDGTFRYVTKTKWMFYVTGFLDALPGQGGHCHVLMFDRSETPVPNDNKGRVTIDGRKYPRKFWNH